MNNKFLEQWISESIVDADDQYRKEYINNINEYKRSGWWTVKEAICLLLCHDPYSSDLIRKIAGDIAFRLEWQVLRVDDRMLTVKGNADEDVLDRFVRPVEFLRWAMSLGYPIPAELKDLVADAVPEVAKTAKLSNKVLDKQDALAVAAEYWETNPDLRALQVAEAILENRRIEWRCQPPEQKTLRDWLAPHAPKSAKKIGRPPGIPK